MKCSKCGFKLPENVLFCPNCGEAANNIKKDNICPNCGQKLGVGSVFCDECGTNLKTGETQKSSTPPMDNAQKGIITLETRII